jgi:hypothetical protein
LAVDLGDESGLDFEGRDLVDRTKQKLLLLHEDAEAMVQLRALLFRPSELRSGEHQTLFNSQIKM